MSLIPIDPISEDQELQRLQNLVGARLKKFREVKGLSQAELAYLIGHKCYRQIGRWETGQVLPCLHSLIKLSFVLNRQIIDLVYPFHNHYRLKTKEKLDLEE